MTYDELWRSLLLRYDRGEARAVARFVLETAFGLTQTEIVCGATEQLPAAQQQRLADMQQRLLAGEPVQYVAGIADFGPHQYVVRPGVLIPRPETYELCQWVVDDDRRQEADATRSVLDIGTGSGCIACTLAAEIPHSQVTAWDISDEALLIAAENAKRSNVHVSFEKVDVLTLHPSPFTLHPSPITYDIIVSNPPYICRQEAVQMEQHVLEHEPALALFVPDDDPLLFYRAIARYAAQSLKPDGSLFFEINPLYVNEMQQMLREEGFSYIEVRNDQFGKQRFTKACL